MRRIWTTRRGNRRDSLIRVKTANEHPPYLLKPSLSSEQGLAEESGLVLSFQVLTGGSDAKLAADAVVAISYEASSASYFH